MIKLSCILICVLCLLAVSIPETNALYCWKCSSSYPPSVYCKDPFDESLITTENQLRYGYTECKRSRDNFYNYDDEEEDSTQVPMCKKMIRIDRGVRIVSRSCVFQNSTAPLNACARADFYPDDDQVKVTFCETCTTDGCNGAGKIATDIIKMFISIGIASFVIF